MQNQVREGFQISPYQEYLWLIATDNPSFQAQGSLLLQGPLDAGRLRQTIEQIVGRHEILRTTYHCPPNVKVPFQVVDGCGGFEWRELEAPDDGGALSNADGEMPRRARMRQPFDLANGPVLRCALLRLGADRHILYVSLPALSADVGTVSRLFEEISLGYGGRLADELPGDTLMQFADFAAWQRELLESDEAKQANAYWRRKFSTHPLSASRLPLRAPDVEPDASVVWHAVDAVIAPATLTRMKTQVETGARRQAVSVSTWLLACWQVLLWRLVGDPAQVIGLEVDGRSHEDLTSAFGLLARTLPVYCHFDPGVPFSQILRQLQDELSEMSQWQDYFVLPPAVRANLSPSGEAVFPVSFAYHEVAKLPAAHDVSFAIVEAQARIDRGELMLCCVHEPEALKLRLWYDGRKFARAEVERLSEQFIRLLTSATESPEKAIDELEMLGERERNQLLFGWNQTRAAFPAGRLIHQLFEEQVERTPEAVAVVFEEQALSYGELNARANRLAWRLRELGVGPEAFVAIWFERSTQLLTAILAILKAGGVYVPLDPTQPAVRISLMLEEVAPRLVLTARHLADRLPLTQSAVLCLDEDDEGGEDRESQAGGRADNLSVNLSGHNLAYVIFTSGSTGRPKGVGIEHRQLVNYTHAVVERLKLPPGASYAMVSTFAADLGHTVLFPSLCTGGSLHIISPACLADGERLGQYFEQAAIDCVKIVPSHFEALQRCARPERVMPRRLLVLGGEASRSEWVQQCQQLAPACRILNHYGPTETTVGVLTHEVQQKQPPTSGATPLGRPLANSRIYLLDRHLRPVPCGVPGEIYVGGANVGRGYIGRADLTAGRFLPDAFSDQPGARMYRTGDVARQLPNGEVEFLGRNDHQVKIRGYRVDLGEVEVALESHGAVRQAVVRMNLETPGEPRLIAYVVPRQLTYKVAVSDLRLFLQSRLPDYMIPAFLVWLDFLPLTANGKIAFDALPPLERIISEMEHEIVAPRNAVEAILAGIWKEVLNLERISIYDDFFELGGHSLLVMQIIARVRDSFQVDLPPTALFEATTVADLAQLLLTLENKPGQMERIAVILQQLDEMSEEEASAALAARQDENTEKSENIRGDQA